MPSCADSHGAFLTTLRADETQIEASFREAIRIVSSRKQSLSSELAVRKESAGNYVQRMIDSDHAESVCVACR
jgi:hypothetical protein